MSNGKAIPVRLNSGLIARLDAASERMGTKRSPLIRYLVKEFVDYFEKHDGVLGLPLNWRDILHDLDGRTYGQQKRFPQLRVAERPNEDLARKKPKKK